MRQRSVRPYVSLVLVLALGLAVGWGLINRYSVAPQDQSYVEPAKRFLSAAVTADSVQLAKVAVPQVIGWALETGRTKPILLSALLNGLRETEAWQVGDSTVVLYSSNGFRSCSNPPLAITFAGPPSKARLVALSAGCEPR
jgi:hypothetical protein